jgi:hypothetical protein
VTAEELSLGSSGYFLAMSKDMQLVDVTNDKVSSIYLIVQTQFGLFIKYLSRFLRLQCLIGVGYISHLFADIAIFRVG